MNYSKRIVTTMAFLAGVSEENLIRIYANENNGLLTKLRSDSSANLIRNLSIMRTKAIRKYASFSPNIFTAEERKMLGKHYISFLESSDMVGWIIALNHAIYANIEACRVLFPADIGWQAVYDLFVMKGCVRKVKNAGAVVQREIKKYKEKHNLYPFQVYIHWKPHDCGNMFHDDRKFCEIIKSEYKPEKQNQKTHTDPDSVLKPFVNQTSKSVIAVDCENTDAYKLMSILEGLEEGIADKIDKVMLFTDSKVPVEWQAFSEKCRLKTQIHPSGRVLEHKSTVDFALITELCREHFERKANSFIIVSSDSDFLSVVSSLKTAYFLMMTENEKCSDRTIQTLNEMDIPHISLDDFDIGNLSEYKMAVMLGCLKEKIDLFNKSGVLSALNYHELMNSITDQCHVTLNDNERRSFVNRYLLSLKLTVANDDNYYIEIPA